MNINQLTVNNNLIQQVKPDEFIYDIDLDKSIFDNDEITELYNEAIDGYNITELTKIFSINTQKYKYCDGRWEIIGHCPKNDCRNYG